MMTILKRRGAVTVLALTATVLVVGLSGCGVSGGSGMNSDEAREQLTTAVEAVQGATGENWEVEVGPGIASCSRDYGQWTTAWNGTPTTNRDDAYKAVREALEEAGFTTSINGADTSTPVLLAQTGDGFGLGFSMPVEGGPIGFDVSSDCFLEEE